MDYLVVHLMILSLNDFLIKHVFILSTVKLFVSEQLLISHLPKVKDRFSRKIINKEALDWFFDTFQMLYLAQLIKL